MTDNTTALGNLRLAIQNGVTLADFLQVYQQENPPSAEDLALIEAARAYHVDGDLEFDDYTMVSGGDDATGDYVLCWKWVYAPRAAPACGISCHLTCWRCWLSPRWRSCGLAGEGDS